MSATDWPSCPHRELVSGFAVARCHHPRVLAVAGVRRNVCETCVFRLQPRESPPTLVEHSRLDIRRQPCIDLGPVISRLDASGRPTECPRRWLRRCAVHGLCTLADPDRPEVACCQRCSDYTP